MRLGISCQRRYKELDLTRIHHHLVLSSDRPRVKFGPTVSLPHALPWVVLQAILEALHIYG